MSRGNAYRELGDLERALNEYDAALADRPWYVNALYNKAGTLLELGRYLEAEELFAETANQSRRQDILLPKAYYYWSLAQYKQGRYDDAFRTVKTATERSNDPHFMILRAKLHSLIGQPGESMEWLRKGLAVSRAELQAGARDDPDFDNVRNDPEYGRRFRELVGEDAPPATPPS